MDASMFLGQLGAGLAVGLAAVGSSLGAGAAGMKAAGEWAKDVSAGQPLQLFSIV